MANDNQRDGSGKSRGGSSDPGSNAGVGKQGQGGEPSRSDQDTSNAQQEQGGSASQQGGRSDGDRNDERLDDGRSKSSPRSHSDAPDEGKGGRS